MNKPWKIYKEHYAYSLKEVLNIGLTSLGYTSDYPLADTTIFTRSLFTPYGITFPAAALIPAKYIDSTRLDLLNKIIERYWDEYIFQSEEYMEDASQLLSFPDILYKTRRFIGKLISIIEFTYEKYTAILKSYDSEKSHLLDQLNKTISGSDTRRDNDTPQDEGDYDNDAHTSFISQGQVSNIENWDDTSIIERLDKIQNMYQKTMFNWVNEFKGLFIEGGNYHEI